MRAHVILIPIFLMISCKPSIGDSINRAADLYEKGKYKESIQLNTEVIEKNYKLQMPYYYRGLSYLELDDFQNALADFNMIISQHEAKGPFIINYNSSSPFGTDV